MKRDLCHGYSTLLLFCMIFNIISQFIINQLFPDMTHDFFCAITDILEAKSSKYMSVCVFSLCANLILSTYTGSDAPCTYIKQFDLLSDI